MNDNINVEVKRKNPSIPPKNLRELTKQVSEIEGTIDDINESVEEAEQDVNEIKRAIDNSDDFVIRDNKFKRKNKAYSPAQYSGLGEIYLEKNETFLGREFDEFVVNVDVPDPTAIAETFDGLVYDRHRKEFLVYELVDGERVYYAKWIKFDKWESTDDYVPEAGYDFICEADNKAYRWTEETTPDLIETVANYGNVLKQEMINFSNTIYHIQYDYDLIGKEITIPEGCLLEFEGGAISNGTLVGQNTILVYNQPFNDILTATLEGTWRHESGVKADEEDITDINGELKFKDKAYIPADYSGLGRKYLRKNLVNGVNTLTQEMMSGANTIYVIQYDFILNENITIPANCVLEFDGGSISGNGTGKNTITGANTQIKAQDVAIFNNGIVIAGTWICPRIPSDWFSDITSNNRLQQLINLSSNSIDNTIIVKEGTYVVSNPANAVGPLRLKSNTMFTILGSIQLTPNNFPNCYVIELCNNVENITIDGTGEIVGDYLLGHSGTSGQWGYNIALGNCKHITIDGLTLRNAWGDGIAVGIGYWHAPAEDVVIRGCHIHTCRRQGISVVYTEGCVIENCYIHNIFGTAPQLAIDIECDSDTYCKNVIVRNNKLVNKMCIASSAVSEIMEGILIENNVILFSMYYGVNIDTGKGITVRNNFIENVPMSQTNPDNLEDIGVNNADITITSDNQITVNETTYYYTQYDCRYNLLTLLDTTNCVLINPSNNSIISSNTFSGRYVYVASVTPGTYESAISITSNPVAIQNNLPNTVIEGNKVWARPNSDLSNKKVRGIISVKRANIYNNDFNVDHYYGHPACDSMIIWESNVYSNNSSGGDCIFINSDIYDNSFANRTIYLTDSKFINNKGRIGSGNAGVAFVIDKGTYTVIENNHISNYIDTLPGYFVSISGDNSKTIIKNNKIDYSPSISYVVTQMNGWNKEYIFEDNTLNYSISIDTNFLWMCKSITIPVKRGSTTLREGLTFHAQYNGVKYYDTDLNMELKWNGTNWVDVDGSIVL